MHLPWCGATDNATDNAAAVSQSAAFVAAAATVWSRCCICYWRKLCLRRLQLHDKDRRLPVRRSECIGQGLCHRYVPADAGDSWACDAVPSRHAERSGLRLSEIVLVRLFSCYLYGLPNLWLRLQHPSCASPITAVTSFPSAKPTTGSATPAAHSRLHLRHKLPWQPAVRHRRCLR